MKHAKFFSIFVFAALLAYGATGFYFLPIATFQGDLTRIGMLPEAQFGWRKPQPAVDQKLIQQSSWKDADILVIGDSFSDGRIWQTVLTQHGLKVRTESWESTRGICVDFIPWLREQGFTGKYVVFESIERSSLERLSRSVACQHTQYHPNASTDAPREAPTVSFDINQGGYSGKLSIGIRTQLNAWQYEYLSRATDFKSWRPSKDAQIVRVPNGCLLFSNAHCDDALFLIDDQPEEIDGNALKNIKILNARLKDVSPIWAIIPNKSTAYLYHKKQFWNEAERSFNAPNLLRMTQQAIQQKTVDIYPANNTHYSTEGYLLMGNEILQNLLQMEQGQR